MSDKSVWSGLDILEQYDYETIDLESVEEILSRISTLSEKLSSKLIDLREDSSTYSSVKINTLEDSDLSEDPFEALEELDEYDQFLQSTVIIDPDRNYIKRKTWSTPTMVLDAFLDFAKQKGIPFDPKLNARKFGMIMKERGIQSARSGGKRYLNILNEGGRVVINR